MVKVMTSVNSVFKFAFIAIDSKIKLNILIRN